MTTLTLQDIAVLAGVTRQAVTNWRTRRSVRGTDLPFPDPVAVIGGVERFDRDVVLPWLEATGRGRNPEARADVPGIAVPEGMDLDSAVAMLALRTLSGLELSECSESELEDIAHQVDPDGRLMLLAQVRDIDNRREAAMYADALFDASYGPADALDRLYGTRLARAEGNRGLTEQLLDLLSQVADTCRAYLGTDDVAIDLRLDPRGRRVAKGFAGVRVGQLDEMGSAERLMLLHLRISGMHEILEGSLVRVLSAVGLSEADALETVDNIALELGADQVAILVGPGSALCDGLNRDLAKRRSQTIGMRKLVAAFRLPRGMWREAHRQALGLWILRGGEPANAMVAADLSGLGPIEGDELCSDIYAALAQTSGRSYRYGRPVPNRQVGGRGPVVPVGLRAAGLASSTAQNYSDRVNSATLVTRETISGFDVLVASRPSVPVRQPTSLGQLKESKQIKVISGSRIEQAHLEPTGTTRVLSADPAKVGSMIDPLVAAKHYDHAARTEPGDVVFTDRPRPYAVVDEVGGSLVLAPSRIIRILVGRGTGPHALSQMICQLPAEAGDWGTWPIPLLPADQVSVVEQVLEDVLDRMNELARHEQAMKDLITHLVAGVAAGSLAITTPNENQKAS